MRVVAVVLAVRVAANNFRLRVFYFTEDDLMDAMRRINAALQPLKIELRGAMNQMDGEVWYGMANTSADEHSKLGTSLSHEEVLFFRAIVSHKAV